MYRLNCNVCVRQLHTVLVLYIFTMHPCYGLQKVLYTYASELLKRLPKTATGGTSAAAPYLGTEWHVRMSEEDEGVVCNILATAEWCRETTEALATAIQKDIKAEYSDKVCIQHCVCASFRHACRRASAGLGCLMNQRGICAAAFNVLLGIAGSIVLGCGVHN